MKKIILNKGYFTIVDDEDYEELNKLKWFVAIKNIRSKTAYAERSYKLKNKNYRMIMHRIIVKAPSGADVDHINGDGLDNRKVNLRICTKSQNAINFKRKNNVTGFRGVEKRKIHESWFARIKVDKKSIYLGNFKTPQEAAIAYNEAAKKYHGEYAILNNL